MATRPAPFTAAPPDVVIDRRPLWRILFAQTYRQIGRAHV
jgi:hypothetical protein